MQKPLQPPNPFKGNGQKGKSNQGGKRITDWEPAPPSLMTGPTIGSQSSGASRFADATVGGSVPILSFCTCVPFRAATKSTQPASMARPTPETVQPLLVWQRRCAVSPSQTLRRSQTARRQPVRARQHTGSLQACLSNQSEALATSARSLTIRTWKSQTRTRSTAKQRGVPVRSALPPHHLHPAPYLQRPRRQEKPLQGCLPEHSSF